MSEESQRHCTKAAAAGGCSSVLHRVLVCLGLVEVSVVGCIFFFSLLLVGLDVRNECTKMAICQNGNTGGSSGCITVVVSVALEIKQFCQLAALKPRA